MTILVWVLFGIFIGACVVGVRMSFAEDNLDVLFEGDEWLVRRMVDSGTGRGKWFILERVDGEGSRVKFDDVVVGQPPSKLLLVERDQEVNYEFEDVVRGGEYYADAEISEGLFDVLDGIRRGEILLED